MASYTKGKAVKLSNNFNLKEFDCKCNNCKKTIVDAKLVNSLQKIRDKYNKPVIINSAYRCASHNKKVGGATLSKHVFGMAADIRIKGVAPEDIAAYAESIGIKGIGLYPTFVHIDTRRTKSYWRGNSQEYVSTFCRKSNRVMAEEVVNGKWGVGAARKKKLSAAGYDYKEIQALVNELLRK